MNEKEVNKKVKKWLEKQGYSYKGVLTHGDVPVPGTGGKVKLDAHGVRLINEKGDVVEFEEGKGYDGNSDTKDCHYESVWVEAKGDVGMSDLIEAFGRVCYAVWHGNGLGVVAVPKKQFEMMVDEKEFFAKMAELTVGKGKIEIMNAEIEKILYYENLKKWGEEGRSIEEVQQQQQQPIKPPEGEATSEEAEGDKEVA